MCLRPAADNAVLQAALKASYDVLESSLLSERDRLASFEERQRAVGKCEWDALEDVSYLNWAR